MRAVNLDTLVRIGQPPWRPVPEAQDVDIWDKYDFPSCGTYRLGDDLIIFALITTAGSRSLWAYVPVSPGAREVVTGARFDTGAEFNAWLEFWFAGHEAVFAAAENFVIDSKSDGTLVPPRRNALLAAGTRWYADRLAALRGPKARRPVPDDADADALLRAAQGALTHG
jgi:hypothetical protein